MRAKHTSGPWKVKPGIDRRPYWRTPDTTARPEGTTERPMLVVVSESVDPPGIAYVWPWHGDDEMRANAELMARAPDLERARLEILDDINAFQSRSENDEAAEDDLAGMLERWRLILELSGLSNSPTPCGAASEDAPQSTIDDE